MALADAVGLPPDGYQGNWIPHRLRPAVEDGIFFAGDSAGHCLPLTAEGIRTAFYFAIALGRELRDVLDGRQDRDAALARYGAFSDAHRWKYESMLKVQHLIPRLSPRAPGAGDAALLAPGPGAVVVPALPADRAAGVRAARAAGRGLRGCAAAVAA